MFEDGDVIEGTGVKIKLVILSQDCEKYTVKCLHPNSEVTAFVYKTKEKHYKLLHPKDGFNRKKLNFNVKEKKE